ncbi:MAG TPA: tetratricopeptide repeat protein [Polyangiaceae bacterium]|nr:tetratricopeptide repeat protein [Polyangiaceae bacterium]
MDQFTAHLDRGWDLAQRGDARGAELSARRALELEAQSPEAHNLLGYACALRGEFDEALELYRQALALDDTFLEAMLNAAELCIHPLGEMEDALGYCNDALELVETDEELTDTLLLQFDALVGLGRHPEALEALRRIPDGPFTSPAHAFLVGRAFFEMGQTKRAEELLLEASRRDPENPEAPYYLALIRDERGDTLAATEAFLKTRQLDLLLPHPPWALSPDAFLTTVRRVAETITPRLRASVEATQIFTAEAPGVEAVVDGADPRAPVLVDALDEEGSRVRIFVYQRNIERLCGSLDRLDDEVRSAIEREVAAVLLGDDLAAPPEGTPLN